MRACPKAPGLGSSLMGLGSHYALQVRELSFGYDAEAALFDCWSHQFSPSSITAVFGASGCGKSTLLYLLGLMLRPSSGEIVIGGRPTAGLSDAELADIRAHDLGFVFQDAALDPSRSIIDNVLESCLYRRQSPRDQRQAALRWLEELGVELDPARKPGKISGGQAQRIALCRALLPDPAIVLADEPTGNLDDDTAALVLDVLERKASAGATVIVVTHDARVAERSHEQVRL